jgi:CxxC motif-containing protein (DUF1111 family)
MCNLTLIRWKFARFAIKLACGVLGICSVSLILAMPLGVDGNDLANGFPASPQDNAKDEAVEAPTGFNNSTNGFEDQAAFDNDRQSFELVEENKDGLGPVYNATSCVSCHQNPVTGSSSQVSEIRAGHLEPDPKNPKTVIFIEPPGGSLIHQRAIDAAAQEHVRPEDETRTLRMSTNTLGNGFVEVIPDEEIRETQRNQPDGLKGFFVPVPVVVGEKKGAPGDFIAVWRIGRFGWKCQEASLLNFSANAYLNEIGITSPLQPKENKSNGRDVSQFDLVPDPEDPAIRDPKDPHPFGKDVESFTRFMRSTKAPPRDFSLANTDAVMAGEKIFRDLDKDGKPLPKGAKKLGCAICHRPDYTTPKAGTLIKALYPVGKPGSDLPGSKVPEALGNKIIHPYSDFMLHDVGTKDAIVQTQHAQSPPRGVENLETIPDDHKMGEGLLRIEARPLKGKRRVLITKPGLDQRTINMVRTAPLWGLRVRPQLMHDGLSLTLDDAIIRHSVQSKVGNVDLPANFQNLTDGQKKQLKAFLNSL